MTLSFIATNSNLILIDCYIFIGKISFCSSSVILKISCCLQLIFHGKPKIDGNYLCRSIDPSFHSNSNLTCCRLLYFHGQVQFLVNSGLVLWSWLKSCCLQTAVSSDTPKYLTGYFFVETTTNKQKLLNNHQRNWKSILSKTFIRKLFSTWLQRVIFKKRFEIVAILMAIHTCKADIGHHFDKNEKIRKRFFEVIYFSFGWILAH